MSESLDKEMARFGKKLAIYLKANLEEALEKGRKRGGSNPQEANLTFNEVLSYTPDGIKVQIIATGEYWRNIEDGRKPGKMPPSNVLGKKWQNKNNINAKNVYLEIQANYRKKKGLSTVNRTLSKTKSKLSYDEYAKRLSFVFAKAIERDGITPKPFVQQAIKEAKVDEFQKKISEAMGQDIRIQLELNNTVTPIKLNF